MHRILLTISIIYFCIPSSLEVFGQEKMGGLALYTVRDAMKENPEATLRTIAEMGYLNIEAAGYANGKYYEMTPGEFKSFVEELGLNPISTHQADITLKNADKMFADAKAAGFQYFVVPIPPMGMFEYNNKTQTMGMKGGVIKLTEILTLLGEKCKKAGMDLLYHNHDFEFKKDAEGIIPIDYLLENTNPAFVNFQMDLFWVTKAGVDPIAYLKKYPNRFKIWHVKDMDKDGKFAPVGQGEIDFTRILQQRETSGMLYYMVEQDQTFDLKPLEAIRLSHKALKTIGFQ